MSEKLTREAVLHEVRRRRAAIGAETVVQVNERIRRDYADGWFDLSELSSVGLMCLLADEIATLREALEPFAVGVELFYKDDPDTRTVSIGRWYGEDAGWARFSADTALTVGHIRRAHAALNGSPQDRSLEDTNDKP